MTTFTLGQRVRTTGEMAVFNAMKRTPRSRDPIQIGKLMVDIDVFGAGATGTVTDVSPDAAGGMPIAHVRMDDHFAGLDEWNNELQVFRASEQCADVTDDLFSPVKGA